MKKKLLVWLLALVMMISAIAVGTIISTSADSMEITLNVTPVAQIGETQYRTLQEAVSAANDGDTITLLDDAYLTARLDIAKAITIDGNGYTITSDPNTTNAFNSTGTIKTSRSSAVPLLNVTGQGFVLENVTLKTTQHERADISISGEATLRNCFVEHIEAGAWGFDAIQVSGGHLIVDGKLTVVIGSCTRYYTGNNGANQEVPAGRRASTWSAISVNSNADVVTFTENADLDLVDLRDIDGSYQVIVRVQKMTDAQFIGLENTNLIRAYGQSANNDGYIMLSDAGDNNEFVDKYHPYRINGEYYDAKALALQNLPEGYVFVPETKTYGENSYTVYNAVSVGDVAGIIDDEYGALVLPADVVAQIAGTNRYYTDLQMAFDAAQDGDTVLQLADIGSMETPYEGYLRITKSITFDMDGHSIISKRDRVLRVTWSSDDVIANGEKIFDVTLKNGTIKAISNATHNGDSWGPMLIRGYGEINIENMNFYNERYFGNGIYIGAVYGWSSDYENTLTVNFRDCTFDSRYGGGLEVEGRYAPVTVNLYDCTLTQTYPDPQTPWTSVNVAASFGGTLNVYNSTLTSENFGVYVYTSGGTINVYGGTVNMGEVIASSDPDTYGAGAISTINLYGGTFNTERYTLDSYNGGIVSINLYPGAIVVTKDEAIAVPEGYVVAKVEGGYTAALATDCEIVVDGKYGYNTVEDIDEEVVAQFADTGYYFTDLQKAFDAAEGSKASIVLLKDVLGDFVIAEKTEITLDLNGKTIRSFNTDEDNPTKDYSDVALTNNGTLNLNLNDGRIVAHRYGIVNNGTMTIGGDGFVYTVGCYKRGNAAVVNYGTAVINGGTYGDSDNDRTNVNTVNVGWALTSVDGIVTVNGGNFTACDNYAYIYNGQGWNGYAYAIGADGGFTIINNANVYGANNGNVFCTGGKVFIYGGTYELARYRNNNCYYNLYCDDDNCIYVYGGTFKNFSNNGIISTQEPCDSVNGRTYIYGGTFYGNKMGANTKSFFVSGGTYNLDPTAYVVEGYKVLCEEGTAEGFSSDHLWTVVMIVEEPTPDSSSDTEQTDESVAGEATITSNVSESLKNAISEEKLEELLDTDSDLITDLIAEVNEVVKADQNAAQDTTEASKTDENTSINKTLAVAVTPQGTQQGETAATTVFVFDVKPTLTVTVEKTYTSGEETEKVTKTATATVTNKDLDGETVITFILPATGIADGTYLDVYHIDPVEGKTVKIGTFRVENGKVEVSSKTFSTFFYNINDEATLAVATAQQEAAATIDPQQYEDVDAYNQAVEEAMAQAAEDTLAELAQEAAPDTTGYVAYIRVDNGIVLFETVSEAIAYNEANEANDPIVLLTDINENIIVVDGTTFTIDKSAHNYKFNANYVPNDSYLFMSVDTDSANNVFSVEFWQQKLILDLNGYTVTGYTDGQVTPIYISIYDEDEETYAVKESYPFEQIVGWKDGIPHYLTGWTVSYTPVEGDEVVLEEQAVDFETFTGAQFINVVDHAIYLQPQWAPFVAGIIGKVDVAGTTYTVNTADYNKDDPANYFTSAKTALTSVENFEIITLYADVANLWNVMLRHIPAIDLVAKEGRFFVDRNGGYDYQLNIGLDGLAVRHLSTIEDQSEVAYEDIDEYYFKDNRFLLTFDLNGGEIDSAAQLEGSINLNNTLLGIEWVAATYNTVPTKAGLTFAGWYIDADTALTDAIVMPAEDLTIYAMWTLDDATITGVEEDPEEEFDGILSKTYDLATDDIVAAHEAEVTYQWYRVTADGPVAIEGENTDTMGFRNVAQSGTYVLKVTYSDYFGEQTKSYEFNVVIDPKDISGLATDETLALEYSSDLTYNAQAQSPTIDEFTYTVGDESEDVTYTIIGNSQTNAGDYQMTLTGTENYTGSIVKDWAIAQKAVTITVNNPGSKIYGDDDPAFTATVDGVVDQYQIAYTVSRVQGENIGDYTVSITAAASQGNYTVTATDTKTFTITPATVTVTADAKEKVYGANDPAFTATVTGLKLQDTVSAITYTLSRAEGENVGTYVITPAGEATQGNYTVVYEANDLTITAKALSEDVTLTLDADKTYTGVQQTMDIVSVVYASAQGDKTLVEGTDYQIVAGTNVGTNAGEYTLTIQGIGNYSGTLSETWNINKAVLTVTADNKSKTYGQLDPEFTYTATGMQNNEDAAELLEDTEIQFTRQNANTNDVGTYDITPSGADAIDNYTISYVKGTLTINRAALTVTADSKSKTYGAADEALTWTATGLVNGDTQAALLEANALVVNISRVAGEAVSGSPYTITVTGAAEQGNYNVTYVNGGYTISNANITVTTFAQTNYEATTRGNTTASVATNAVTKTISTVNNTPYTITYRLLPNANFAPVSDEFGAMPDFTNAPAGLYDLEYKITAENHNEATGYFTLKISVARVGNANVANNYYFSFYDAVQAAGNGATVTLLVDDSYDTTITLDKSLNINLNGNTYTYTTAGNTQQAFLIDEGCAEFNMYDGTLVSASRGIVSNVETTIILTDVTLTANTFGIRSTGSNSTIELTNDTIEATTAVYLRRIADGSFIESGFYKGAINANNCGRFIRSGYFTVNGLTPYAVAGMAEVACNTTQDAEAIAAGYNYKIGTATVEVNGEYYETFDQALAKAAELRNANPSAAPIIYLLCDYTQASMDALGLDYQHDFDLKDYGFGDDAEFYVMPADGILCRYSASMIYEDDAYTLDSDVKVYQNLPEYLMSAHYKVSEVIAVVSQHASNDVTKYASLRMAFNDIANGDFGMAVDLKMVHDSNESINVALNYPDIADESDPISIYFDLNGTTLGGKLELGGYVTIINSAATSATVEHLVVEQKNPLHYITLDANANYTLIEVNVGWLYINAGDVDTLINSDNTVINGGSFHNIDNQQNLQINQGAKFYLGTYDNTELTEFSDLIAWIGTFDVAAVLNDNDNPTYVTTAVNP